MMKNIYQQQYIDYYMKPFNMKTNTNLYALQDMYQSQNAYMPGVQNSVGTITLSIIDEVSREYIPNATITVYVTDGTQRDIPIMHLITTLNPVSIVLPITYELGTQITGPEYNFSTFNVRVDVFGYYSNVVYNIRLFPNTAANFVIGLVPIGQLEVSPRIEERLDIPPHPRDVISERA